MLSLLTRFAAVSLFDLSLLAGFGPSLLNWLGQPQLLTINDPVGINQRISAPWSMLFDRRDPEAQAIVQRYLQSLQAVGLSPQAQGIWLQSGLFPLAENQSQTPLPAASLTKIATSLAALETWGPNHQFETHILTNGKLQNGVINGDLIVQGGGDPLFVWEEAIALGNTLNRLGIRQVTGDLVITGNFGMNYEWEPIQSGESLRQALNAPNWTPIIEQQYTQMPKGTPKPQVVIAGNVRQAAPTTGQLLVQHQSLPLWNLLKRLNVYSNNFMADALASLMGGPSVVIQKASAAAEIDPAQVRLINGSGLGEENQISPQAASAMFTAIQRYASLHQLNIADLFPISGTDIGTIEDRTIPKHAVVKTGTLNTVSALAGVFPTQKQGLVAFTIINRGSNLEGLRASQDVLLRQLQQTWGAPPQPPAEVRPIGPMQAQEVKLGSTVRNIIPTSMPVSP